MISPDLAAFLEPGYATVVATRNARRHPDAVHACGVRVEPGGAELTVYLPVATAAVAIANLEDNRRIAITMGRPTDHKSVQVKGRALEIRAATDADREVVERHRALMAREYGFAGIPTAINYRIVHWPCHAVRVQVEGLFRQTPGPNAGEPMGAPR